MRGFASRSSGGPSLSSVTSLASLASLASIAIASLGFALPCASAAPLTASPAPQPIASAAPSANGDDELPAGLDPPRLVPTAVVDGYYAFHGPAPARDQAPLSTSVARHNAFGINLVAAGFRVEHARLYGEFVAQAGSSVDAAFARETRSTNATAARVAMAAGSPDSGLGGLGSLGTLGDPSTPFALRLIQTAFVGYRHGDFSIEAGVMPSQLGVEPFASTANANLTRAMLSDVRPYFVAGLRASWRASPNFTLSLTGHNGFQVFFDANKSKSATLRAEWRPSDNVSIADSLHVGAELTDVSVVRFANDLALRLRLGSRVALALEALVARDQGGGVDAMFYAASAWAKFGFTENVFLAARAEGLIDQKGYWTAGLGEIGLNPNVADLPGATRAAGATLTLGWSPHPNVLARLEGVQRFSNNAFLNVKDRLTTFAASIAFSY